MVNGLLNNFGEKDKNQTLLNGLDLNNGVKVTLQDYSTMKFQIHSGSDMKDTLMILKKHFILLQMQINNKILCLGTIQLLKKEKKNSNKIIYPFNSALQKFSQKNFYSHMNLKKLIQMSLISKEFGNGIDMKFYFNNLLIKLKREY
jgi:hypothetical protein